MGGVRCQVSDSHRTVGCAAERPGAARHLRSGRPPWRRCCTAGAAGGRVRPAVPCPADGSPGAGRPGRHDLPRHRQPPDQARTAGSKGSTTTLWDPNAAGVVELPSGRRVRGRGLRRSTPAGPRPDPHHPSHRPTDHRPLTPGTRNGSGGWTSGVPTDVDHCRRHPAGWLRPGPHRPGRDRVRRGSRPDRYGPRRHGRSSTAYPSTTLSLGARALPPARGRGALATAVSSLPRRAIPA